MFTMKQDVFVILHSAGVYKSVKVATLDGIAHAQYGSGWVRLFKDGSTSKKSLSWKDFNMKALRPGADSFGRVTL